jgi:hypothetical protein
VPDGLVEPLGVTGFRNGVAWWSDLCNASVCTKQTETSYTTISTAELLAVNGVSWPLLPAGAAP